MGHLCVSPLYHAAAVHFQVLIEAPAPAPPPFTICSLAFVYLPPFLLCVAPRGLTGLPHRP